MDIFLAPHVFAADVGGDLVFLDVRGDRYLCASPGSGLSLCDDRRTLRLAGVEIADELAGAGLATDRPGPAWFALPPPRPLQDLPPAVSGRLRGRDAVDAAVASVDVFATYPRRSLQALLQSAARYRTAPPDAPSARLLRIAQGFRRWAPFTPLPAKCLLRSFMLLRVLRRSGEDAAWVIGVTTRPFSAHCWLQVGDMVLDDAWERLRRFEPILAA